MNKFLNIEYYLQNTERDTLFSGGGFDIDVDIVVV